MKRITQQYDVVVAGGGLAGFCAAIAAARGGAKTCLVQDRPVLGGNSSSEVRVTPHGAAAFHAYARETGIISEVLIEERARNHERIIENGWTNSIWDLVLYDVAQSTANLTLHVNTPVVAVVMEGAGRVDSTPPAGAGRGYLHRPACAPGRKLEAVIARVGNAEVELTLRGKFFLDCTGDGLVADLAGCEWRMGSEGKDEFDEPHAPAQPSKDTMGNSLHFRARNMGRPVPFAVPAWAVRHEDASYFYQQGRVPKTLEGGYWWLEIGVPWDTIHEAEDIRHELTRHTLGVWDWIKNKDPRTREAAANYALDWIGQVPGKRESRRIIGRYFMTEHDVQQKTVFQDEVAYGGWFLDLHTPGGLLAPTSEPASAEGYQPNSDYMTKSYVGPYGIPLGILIAKDLDNLMMAGRNVSVTHAALGTVRVMATTALMGQALGTACAQGLKSGKAPCEFDPVDVAALQQQLLRDGCFLPGSRNQDAADLARLATVTASSEDAVGGIGPDDNGCHEGLTYWKDQAVSTGKDELHARRGQWIGTGSERIESIEVLLTNLSNQPQEVPAWLLPVDHIWDYRVEGHPPIAEGRLIVPPGGPHWVRWSVGCVVNHKGYLRLDLGGNPLVCWHASPGIVPGHVSASGIGNGRKRRYGIGVTLCYRITPAQRCFGPEQVLSGVTRPYQSTNLWRSNPADALPQSLELSWTKPQQVGRVELTFPGHLVREYHAYAPLYRDPQCPRDYRIDAWTGDRWEVVVEVAGNYQRHCIHRLPKPKSILKLRVMVSATNGDPAASIYEVRCYPD